HHPFNERGGEAVRTAPPRGLGGCRCGAPEGLLPAGNGGREVSKVDTTRRAALGGVGERYVRRAGLTPGRLRVHGRRRGQEVGNRTREHGVAGRAALVRAALLAVARAGRREQVLDLVGQCRTVATVAALVRMLRPTVDR